MFMYERWTDRARKVMQLANQEAQRFNHEYIGTEHILLGLIKEGSGVAAKVLNNLGIDLRRIRLEVEKIVQFGPDMVTMGKLPQTPQAKKAVEYSIEEARNLNHPYIGTQHLMLGLLRAEEGVAAQVLMNLGLNLEDVRFEVLNYPLRVAFPSRNVINEIPSDRYFQPQTPDVRFHSLEQQLWNVRIVLGALVGAIAGALLLAQFGAAMGLLLGGLVAALGWRTLGILAGGSVGVLLGCTHLPNDGGGLAGALLGALVGFLITEIRGATGSRGFLGNWRR
jgi:hypothetical protein